MIIQQKDIDFIRELTNDLEGAMFQEGLVRAVLEQTEIFHHLMAIKILKGEPVLPSLFPLCKIIDILEGIDKTEIEDENGWWETSSGAEFGAEKLKKIKEILSHFTV